MPDSVKFSELPSASDLGGGDLVALAAEDQQAETGYTSKKAAIQQLGGFLNNALEYPTALQTSEKKIIPAINGLQDLIIGQLPVDSASGSLANFTTSLALPLVALKTYIKAQGGGGTPQSAIPISGFSDVNVTRAGVNVFDYNNYEQIDVLGNGTYRNGHIFPSGTYTIINNSTGEFYYKIVKSDLSSYGTAVQVNINSSLNVTVNSGYLLYAYSSLTPSDVFVGIGTNLTYEPYNADTFTINLGQTVYGGYVDWELGKGYITHVKYTPSNTDSISGTYHNSNNCWNFTISSSSDIYKPSGECLSTINNPVLYGNIDKSGFALAGNNRKPIFSLADSDSGLNSSSTISEIANAFHDFIDLYSPYAVYELATPIEIDLPTTMPQTIEGVQNWFADSGDIEVSFKMGVQEYIDKKIAEVQALIL